MIRGDTARRMVQVKRMNRLAELVANGTSISEAGRAMGITKGQAMGLWERIKAGLGAQAL